MTMLAPAGKVKLGLVIDLDTCVGCHACAVACKEWNDGGQFGPLPDVNTRGAGVDGVWFNRVHSYEVAGLGTRDSGLGAKPGMGNREWGMGEKPGMGNRELGMGEKPGMGNREWGMVKAGASRPQGVATHSPFPIPGPQGHIDKPPVPHSLFPIPGPQGHIDKPPVPHSPFPIPGSDGLTVHFPRSCLHCETPECVTVCPTGASYKRAEDGIVLVDEDKCFGCQLCAWACPYGARELSEEKRTMQKCTLCVDRIYNETLDEADRQPACVAACPTRARHFGDLGDPDSAVSRLVAERDGYALQPELGYRPVNRYLPPRPRRGAPATQVHADVADAADANVWDAEALPTPLRWLDRLLSR